MENKEEGRLEKMLKKCPHVKKHITNSRAVLMAILHVFNITRSSIAINFSL